MKVELIPGRRVEHVDQANAEILVRWETFQDWNRITQATDEHLLMAIELMKHRLRILEGEQARREGLG